MLDKGKTFVDRFSSMTVILVLCEEEYQAPLITIVHSWFRYGSESWNKSCKQAEIIS